MPNAILALNGGPTIRETFLPYGHQSINEEDIEAVANALRGDFLTTGPTISKFENAFATLVGINHAVAVNNGTSALHCAMYALDIGPRDEVIVPAMTFVATANAVLMQRGTPIIADVDAETLLIDPIDVERKITENTKAIIAVDYAGQPCDYDALHVLCKKHDIRLVSDACHALGAAYKEHPVGSLADLSTFSFHPVKPATTGEGGMIVTKNEEWADRMRRFRHHNISIDPIERQKHGTWFYEINDLGYNYRLTDIQCALGLSQLSRVSDWTTRRQAIARKYDDAFADLHAVAPLVHKADRSHAYHLYIVQWDLSKISVDRDTIFKALYAENIGVNLHYIPIHLHSLYRDKLNMKPGLCPVAEDAYTRMLTLPLFAGMTDKDATDVIEAVRKIHGHYAI